MSSGSGSGRTAMFVYGNGRGDYLPLNQEPTLGQRKFGRYTDRHEVTGSAFGSFEGQAPSRRPGLSFTFRAGYQWEVVDAGRWLRSGSPDLTAATRELLVARITQLAVAVDPTEADLGRREIEKRLGGRLELLGHGADALLTSFAMWPDIPAHPIAQSANFGQASCRLLAADGVPLDVALGLSWQVQDAVRWHLDRVNEPGRLCEEILVREVGQVVAEFEHDRAAEAQAAVISRLVNVPMQPGHGLVVSLKNARVELGESRRSVDVSVRAERFEAKLSTSEASTLLDAVIDISWRIRDPGLWVRSPIDDPSGQCQHEVVQRLRVVTGGYPWSALRDAEREINEQICRRPLDVEGCIELTLIGVQLRLQPELEQRVQELAAATLDADITKEKLAADEAATTASLTRAKLIQAALDAGLDPDVLRVEADPTGAAEALSNLSFRRHAEEQRRFELLVILAKSGELERDLAQRIIAAATAGALPGGGGDAGAEQRQRPGYSGRGLRRGDARPVTPPAEDTPPDTPDKAR